MRSAAQNPRSPAVIVSVELPDPSLRRSSSPSAFFPTSFPVVIGLNTKIFQAAHALVRMCEGPLTPRRQVSENRTEAVVVEKVELQHGKKRSCSSRTSGVFNRDVSSSCGREDNRQSRCHRGRGRRTASPQFLHRKQASR
ncbi:hypothetical protein ElyMa_002595000 [Elysia marginata]|uniref:Uncharacterized protein n=1 Tax=Elysia marginata TaxID=1093978 RepID=A0AAV4H3C1_9GAST|nr:hypothetical protein ElyMa_002595000 [Elysia marginata]